MLLLLGTQIDGSTRGFNVTGDITVNGQPMSRSFFLENAAYVPQEDRLWSALTGAGHSSCQSSLFIDKNDTAGP